MLEDKGYTQTNTILLIVLIIWIFAMGVINNNNFEEVLKETKKTNEILSELVNNKYK